ncbi:MAG TPA: FAD-binding oxidoreductase [Symbiobacteriaceae bacterium]|jgi:FAD/FMN-containing dehydrogenase
MIIRPDSPAAAAAALAGTDGPVCIRGAGTRTAWQPLPAPGPGLVVETTRLTGPGDLRPDNLSASFLAGTPLSDVHAQLQAAGLWFPVAHCDAPEATLGGCLAAGFESPLRFGYGPPRDWVLGLEVATPQGLIRFGADVIKNVAGYDLVKLHLGAWGRFGLITRATLRLLPLPEASHTFSQTFTGPDPLQVAGAAETAVRAALAAGARPAALELIGQPDHLRLLVATGTGNEDDWQAYSHQRAAMTARYPWRLKLSLPAPGVAAALGLLDRALSGLDWAVAGHAGSGIFTAWWDDPAGPAPALNRLQAQAQAVSADRWFVVAEGAAARAMTGQPGWVSFPPRPPRSQDRLEAALRAALAPGNFANPHLPSPTPEARS